jgi:hypothetical protein
MSFSGGSATSFRLGDPPHALNEPVVLPQQIGREQGRAIRLGEMWEVVDFGEVENGIAVGQVCAVEALDHPGDDQLLLDWVRDTCCCPVSYDSRLSNPLFPHHSPYLMRTT